MILKAGVQAEFAIVKFYCLSLFTGKAPEGASERRRRLQQTDVESRGA